jgi:uncharacterized protein YceK
MNIQNLLLIFTSLVILGGCASQVTRSPDSEGDRPQVRALQHIEVEMSPRAKQRIPDSVDFSVSNLDSHVRSALESRNLVEPDGDFDLRVIINDVRLRSTGSAVMLGVFAGDDHLKADIILLNRAGEEVYTFEANASYALGGWAGGQELRITWLYDKLSEIIAEELVTARDGAREAEN